MQIWWLRNSQYVADFLFYLGLYQDNIGIPCALPDNKIFVEDIKLKEWLEEILNFPTIFDFRIFIWWIRRNLYCCQSLTSTERKLTDKLEKFFKKVPRQWLPPWCLEAVEEWCSLSVKYLCLSENDNCWRFTFRISVYGVPCRHSSNVVIAHLHFHLRVW